MKIYEVRTSKSHAAQTNKKYSTDKSPGHVESADIKFFYSIQT